MQIILHECIFFSTFAPRMVSRIRTYIITLILVVFAQVVNAATELVSADPNWIGGAKAMRTTEGNDFWLTFPNNNMVNPEDPANKNNPDFKFDMKVAVSARETMDVIVAVGNVPITMFTVQGGTTKTYTIDHNVWAKDIYLFESQEQKYTGVHVYAAPGSKDKAFSCFLYSRVGGTGLSSRDASMVIPTAFLGKEYIIQTYPEDLRSTEFAIVATEDNTTVQIVPSFDTYGGKTAAGGTINLTLAKGEAYLVASKEHEGEDFTVDLSGSTICANKPIAVFNGNQQTGIPNREAYSQDFMVEQALPIEQWGTEFYLTNLANTKSNYAIITAAYDDTEVTILTYNKETGEFTTIKTNPLLKRGETFVPLGIDDEMITERYITSDKPITCYSYLTSAAVNNICTVDPITLNKDCYTYGDPANAMMPSWNHRVQSMTLFTEPLDPQGGTKTPQHFFAYVVTKTADVGSLSLDGIPVDGSLFQRFHTNNDMSYAHLPLANASSYHQLESTGEGFVGMVYALTDAQGYFYTLGFTPPHPGDSLYVNHDGPIMSRASYDMDSLDGHGWYQRQEKEWVKARLDTAIVCDSSTVAWTVETPTERPTTKIEWMVYDVTDGKKAGVDAPIESTKTEDPAAGDKHSYQYQFILPEEEMEGRKQFYEYEIQAILYRDRILCTDEPDTDTLKTTVRVTRVFNDTLYRIVCLGDTMRFFWDKMYDQRDLSLSGDHAESTKFIAVKEGEGDGYVEPWRYKIESGKHYEFSRHYLSQAGCDSTMTVEVFVCDTFRFVENIHLCSNQDTLTHEQTFRGVDYQGPRNGEIIEKDTVILVKFKTKQCACQQEEGFPVFKGCDSIYELHLFIHPSYTVRDTDTLCLDVDGKATYTWPIQYDTQTMTITESTPGMVWNESLQAYFGTFRDTMQTKTCAECKDGGCDSIHELHLILPKSYYFNDTAEWCKLHYDPVLRDTVHQYYQWIGKDQSGNDSLRNELTVTGDYYDAFKTRYGCDSIYHIRLDYKASQELYEFVDTTLCFDSTAVYEWQDHQGKVLKTFPLNQVDTTYDYDDSRCDTVYAIKLTVIPKYFIVDTVMISQDSTYHWYVNNLTYGGTKATEHYDILVNQDTLFVRVDDTTEPVNGIICDSIHLLFLRIGNVYRDTVQHFACGEDEEYIWMEDRPAYYPDGVTEPFLRREITDLPRPGTDSIYEKRFETVLGFDSIYYLHLYRAPSYHKYDTVYECQRRAGDQDRYTWDKHSGLRPIYYSDGIEVPFISLRDAGEFDYIDSIRTDSFQCDSIWHLHLHIYKLYDQDTTIHTCQSDDPFVWIGAAAPDSILDIDGKRIAAIPTNHVGDYKYTLRFHTIHDCDSAWHLSLHIDTVYATPVEITERPMCDNDTLHFYDQVIYGVNWPDKPDGVAGVSVPDGKRFFTFDSLYTDHTIHGCDSAVTHRITLYKTYHIDTIAQRCQGEAFEWHGMTIPTNVKSDSVYVYEDPHQTEFGCDSVHILHIRIDSVYHIRDSFVLCDYDSITWQGKHYAGPKVEHPKTGYRVLKADTTYQDTVIWPSVHACDSIYYLTLRVAKSYDTTLTMTVCDYEDIHIFEFSDTHGNYFRDSIPYAPHPELPERDTATTYYPTQLKKVEHTLKTVDGCDSIVHFHLYIKPSYQFVNKGKGCYGDPVEWRGQYISITGTYYDRLTTTEGCDSIFVMEFYITPFITIPLKDTICDNETFWHRDTIYRPDGTPSYFTVGVWSPGMTRPDEYTDVHFKGSDGCDSIIYRYYLTFCPTYFYHDTATVCSGEAFYSDSLGHEWTAWVHDFDVDTFVLPYDTMYIDSLLTYRGCDSVYNLKAHVLPSYRHIAYDTICSNEQYTWHSILYGDSVIAGVKPGIHYLRDSFLTVNDCDSLYEVQLYVKAAYFVETYDSLCADETLQWRSHYFEHMTPGDHFVYDSLTTDGGCDSIYHLYLTVIDTTYEIRYDSICLGDTLFIGENRYTEPGSFKDTTLNAGGCRHFIYTHLAVIEPTVPTFWAERPMCTDETAFELYYTYTNHYPVAYTLLFDSVGHSMGFEDLIDEPVTEYTNPMVISVPIPYGSDRTQYPRPDNYAVRLILDNGICRHKETDCYSDSSFMLSYPKWLTEQRFGDVIALLNENYNGGYTWSEYQWYLGDSLLVGQTQPYLYVPTGLQVGTEYHVRLTREGETKNFPTCPITITMDPISNDYAPTMGYLSVTPTCVVTAHPWVNILSRRDGTYRVNSSTGQFIKEGIFRADVTPIEIPAAEGMYIIQLWSQDTPEEPYRAIKVLVRQRCETCATSF